MGTMLRVGGLLTSLVVLAVMAAPAGAAPPAPGAPGTVHTWAPADKHGFGTSHQLTSHASFTLRAASLTEIYYPDLSTPAFRGLQFVVTDGKTFADRETVDDDPRHIEPVAPGVSAHVEPDGSLAFRQVTSTSRWRLTKTWITDPARATVLARVRFESLTGGPLQLYVLADPAPGNDGNDDLGTSGSHDLVAYDEAAASAVAATPGLRRTTSGYRGSASDPWRALEAMENLHPYDAVEPGNVVQAAATALDGKRHQTMTLAIGFGARPGRCPRHRHPLARRRVRAGRAALPRRLGGLPLRARDATRQRRRRRRAARRLRAVAAGARRIGGQDLPRRVDRLAQHAVDLGHPEARAGSALGPVPPRLASRPLPRGHRAEGRGRRRRGRPLAGLPVAGTEAGRRLVAEHIRQRHREVDDRAARPGLAPDRARLVAGPHGRGRLGRTSSGPPTTS